MYYYWCTATTDDDYFKKFEKRPTNKDLLIPSEDNQANKSLIFACKQKQNELSVAYLSFRRN